MGGTAAAGMEKRITAWKKVVVGRRVRKDELVRRVDQGHGRAVGTAQLVIREKSGGHIGRVGATVVVCSSDCSAGAAE